VLRRLALALVACVALVALTAQPAAAIVYYYSNGPALPLNCRMQTWWTQNPQGNGAFPQTSSGQARAVALASGCSYVRSRIRYYLQGSGTIRVYYWSAWVTSYSPTVGKASYSFLGYPSRIGYEVQTQARTRTAVTYEKTCNWARRTCVERFV